MESKVFKDLENWVGGTQSMFDNLTTFVDDLSKDLTPEEKAMVDDKLKDINLDSFKKEMSNITDKLNSEMDKFKM